MYLRRGPGRDGGSCVSGGEKQRLSTILFRCDRVARMLAELKV